MATPHTHDILHRDASTGVNQRLDTWLAAIGGSLGGDLGAIEALSTTGIAVRTAADTWATRTLVEPAAGFTITNPAGIAGDPTFVLAHDLAALEALGSTGLAARTASNTWAQRTLQAPAAGFTITNPAGIAGDPTFVLANDLTALEELASTGIAVRTAADTWAQRAIQAPVAGLTVTNPAGVAGDPTLVLANDLAALEALSTTGIPVRTTTDTWAQRTLQAPAAGLTIANPAGVAGDPTFAFANDLSALEALSSTGFPARTTTDTWAQRTLIAGTGIDITNGDGVAGNPTIAVSGGGGSLGPDLTAIEALSGTGIAVRTAADTWALRTLTAGAGIGVTNGDGVAGNPTVAIDYTTTNNWTGLNSYSLKVDPAGGIDQTPMTADVAFDFRVTPFAGNWSFSRAANVLSSSLASPNFYPRTTLALNRTALGAGTILTNPFATTSGSPTVVVTHASHGLSNGANVNIDNASVVAGLTIDGDYTVANVVANVSYEITASGNASSTTTGGGTVYVSKSFDNGPDRTNPTIAIFGEKLNWRTSLNYGEIDGSFFVTAQGVRGDTGGINVGAYKIDGRLTGGEGSTLGIEAHAAWVAADYAQEPFAPDNQTCTITNASPAVLTAPLTTNLTTGKGVTLTTTGTLPTGLVAATKYYAISITPTTFSLATTYANAVLGTGINTSSAGSGTHTYTLSHNLTAEWEVATLMAYGEGQGSAAGSFGQGDGMGFCSEGRAGLIFAHYAAIVSVTLAAGATANYGYTLSSTRNRATMKWAVEDDGTTRWFNSFTDVSNFQSGVARWTSNVFELGTDSPGTGTTREFALIRDGAAVLNSFSLGLIVAAGNVIRLASYTVAGVPSAATSGAGAIVYVSNETGGAVLAFSDATNWRRVTDRAIIA